MGRRGARGIGHIRTGTITSKGVGENYRGGKRRERSESRATTIECVGGFD